MSADDQETAKAVQRCATCGGEIFYAHADLWRLIVERWPNHDAVPAPSASPGVPEGERLAMHDPEMDEWMDAAMGPIDRDIETDLSRWAKNGLPAPTSEPTEETGLCLWCGREKESRLHEGDHAYMPAVVPAGAEETAGLTEAQRTYYRALLGEKDWTYIEAAIRAPLQQALRDAEARRESLWNRLDSEIDRANGLQQALDEARVELERSGRAYDLAYMAEERAERRAEASEVALREARPVIETWHWQAHPAETFEHCSSSTCQSVRALSGEASGAGEDGNG